MPKFPTQLIITLPAGMVFLLTASISSCVNPNPFFEIYVTPSTFKSSMVIQGISPVNDFGLSLPGTIQSHSSITVFSSQPKGFKTGSPKSSTNRALMRVSNFESSNFLVLMTFCNKSSLLIMSS